ncbi:MAG: flagellar biosynthetic protein FliR [Fibromonadaceae bacterium]|jgi:flagellar biosynthetic protein FliR|nr:flagellar biosynthetic protein FliR [Fibromonadaceae bacterium]
MLSLASSVADLAVEKIELFILVLVRVSTIVFLLPAFSFNAVPATIKACVSLLLAILVFPQIPLVSFTIANSPVFFFMIVLEQIFIGLIIGFTTAFMLYFVVMGGEWIARDIGLMQGTMNPFVEFQSNIFSIILPTLLMVVYLASGGHYFFIRVLFESFQYIPMGNFVWDTRSFAEILILLSASSFVVGFQFTFPILAVVFLCTVALGLMNRVMPQMQVWILGIPLKVIFGSLMLIYTLPLMVQLFNANFEQLQRALFAILRAGSGG